MLIAVTLIQKFTELSTVQILINPTRIIKVYPSNNGSLPGVKSCIVYQDEGESAAYYQVAEPIVEIQARLHDVTFGPVQIAEVQK